MKLSTFLIGTSVLVFSLSGLKGMTAQRNDKSPDDSDSDIKSACGQLPSYNQLKAALVSAQAQSNGGFGLNMWGAIVNRDGVVCAVAFTGSDRGAQWPGSRVISAQKANTANAFSLPALALSTANLYSAVQPGGSLFGLQESNPVNTRVAYRGDSRDYGKSNDPMHGVTRPAVLLRQLSRRDCRPSDSRASF